MKRLFLFSLLAPLIVACTQPTEEAPAAPEPEVAAAPEAPEPAAYYEFLWCDFGENYSDESRDAYFADFNGIVDSCLLYTSPSPRDATLSRIASCA